MEFFDKIPESLRRRKDINWTAKGVYSYLVRAVGAGFRPGERKIAEECGVSRSAARRAIESLQKAGLMTVHDSGDAARRNGYELHSCDAGTGIETRPLPARDPDMVMVSKRDHSEANGAAKRAGNGTETIPEADCHGIETRPRHGIETRPKVVSKRDHNQSTRVHQSERESAGYENQRRFLDPCSELPSRLSLEFYTHRLFLSFVRQHGDPEASDEVLNRDRTCISAVARWANTRAQRRNPETWEQWADIAVDSLNSTLAAYGDELAQKRARHQRIVLSASHWLQHTKTCGVAA